MNYVTIIFLLLAVAIILCGLITLMMAIHLLKPPRMTDGKAQYILKRIDPSDLGLTYETCDFVVQDDASNQPLKIAGWWLPTENPSQRTVIILHGYSDAKVGGIAWAPMWLSLGWNVLALDLRAHGQSGGDYSTAGYFERDDVSQIIDQLNAARPQSTSQLAIFGVSLGATIAAAVAARRDDIHAIIMESPYSDYLSAIKQHGRRLGMPIEWAFPLAMKIAEIISGAKFDEVKPVDLIPKAHAPLLVIHAGNDTFVNQFQVDQIRESMSSRSAEKITMHQIIPDCEHTLGLNKDPEQYLKIIKTFLNKIENRSGMS